MPTDTEHPGALDALAHTPTSRRAFLRTASLGAVGAGALVACKIPDNAPARGTATTPSSGTAAGATGGTMGAHDTAHNAAAPSPTAQADAMDAMHEKGIKAFPAKTEGKGNQLLQPRIENGVKVYDLTAKVVQWEVEPGRKVEAWTYNGVVPAPQIRVREGDRVRVVLDNQLPESTATSTGSSSRTTRTASPSSPSRR